MKILLIDADSKIPNLALMKISRYHKMIGDEVDLVRLNMPYYPRLKKKDYYLPSGYGKVYCSVVFEGNKQHIHGDGIIFGGTGVDLVTELPEDIEKCKPDYSIYPENNSSYGFITRGCIRNCSFCYVPRKEGFIRKYSSVDEIVEHGSAIFLDNNILAYDGHLDVLKRLVDLKVRCQFNQGLDIRLLTEDNSDLLSQLHYIGEYVFAFDNYGYKKLIEGKLPLLSWRKDWQVKFFVYVNPEMPISDTVKRIEWCRDHKILPFVMRDILCFSDVLCDFYTDIASYCNQPGFFKNMQFDCFLNKRHTRSSRIESSLRLYTSGLC